MKTGKYISVFFLVLFFSGCVVYSFYPLYTEEDLFANDLLTGNWVDEDNTQWNFEHPVSGNKENKITDSTSYLLTVIEEDKKSTFGIHLVELGGHYFLDFYLEEFPCEDDIDLALFHIIPVHTFARLTIENGQLQINWFDQEWLSGLIKENKIRIHHESNDDIILLTAKTKELQKFVIKYVNTEEAFKEGIAVTLTRN